MRPGPVLRAFAIAALVALSPPAGARGAVELTIAAVELPREARDVLANVRRGPPFAYERDGIVFGNREKLLPARPRGYYHEYTVRTPGVKTRGARRIVCGGAARSPDACWYSDDHYQSFRRIVE
jgi:ribonuclease T1